MDVTWVFRMWLKILCFATFLQINLLSKNELHLESGFMWMGINIIDAVCFKCNPLCVCVANVLPLFESSELTAFFQDIDCRFD